MRVRIRKEDEGRFTLFVSHPGHLRLPPLYMNGLNVEQALAAVQREAAEGERIKKAFEEAAKPIPEV